MTDITENDSIETETHRPTPPGRLATADWGALLHAVIDGCDDLRRGLAQASMTYQQGHELRKRLLELTNLTADVEGIRLRQSGKSAARKAGVLGGDAL